MEIKLIGTTHLMSKAAIKEIIKDENPEILGVELCETRFKVLTNQDEQSTKKDESLIGDITDSIKQKAEENNLDYGSDMKKVMFHAINNNIPLMMEEKDMIEIREAMNKIPGEEQLFLQQELIKFQQENIETEVNEEEMLKTMKEKVPITYKILVEERNAFICNKIKEGMEKYPDKRILVFLGKGHVRDIENSLRTEGGKEDED